MGASFPGIIHTHSISNKRKIALTMVFQAFSEMPTCTVITTISEPTTGNIIQHMCYSK